MKICSKCKIEKQFSDFNKCSGSKTGIRPACRKCQSEDAKIYISKNRDEIAEKQRKYSEENPEKVSATRRKYYQANKEKNASRSTAWSKSNPQRISEIQRRYRQSNLDREKHRHSEYRKANPWKASEKTRNRRARKLSAGGTHTAKDVKFIFDSQSGLCINCLSKLIKSGKNKYHIDHIVPLSRGGSNDKYNLQCLCPGCNLRKTSKDPFIWANENGRLL